jgi:hypothetical protein
MAKKISQKENKDEQYESQAKLQALEERIYEKM